MVFAPFACSTENWTLSPGCRALNSKPSDTLKSSLVSVLLPPTVPGSVYWMRIVPWSLSTFVTRPLVIACCDRAARSDATGSQAETHGRTAGGAGRAGRDGPRPGSSRGGALAARGFARRAATALRRRVARTLGRQGSGEARLLPALCAPAPSADG